MTLKDKIIRFGNQLNIVDSRQKNKNNKNVGKIFQAKLGD